MGEHWWQKGIQWQCQGSGKCCSNHGEDGFVYLSPSDKERFAKHLKMSVAAFEREYCQKIDEFWVLKNPKDQDACRFVEDNKCSVYEARPVQCRSWPFWPENMTELNWKKNVEAFCPGAGKGPIVPAEEIYDILQEQKKANSEKESS